MSLDRIPAHGELFVGGLFTLRRHAALRAANISHVLSALAGPLDPDLFAPYDHLVVEVDDVEDEDVLQHFPRSNAFISEGLAGGGGVLVHCAMGKSRSITLTIAYMLHLHPTTTPSAALSTIRQSRPMAEPNSGFMQQLHLYHRMGCPPDIASHPLYQRWLYERDVSSSIACGQAPAHIRFSDEVATSSPDTTTAADSEYRCRKCRRSLATSAYLLPHTPKQAPPPASSNTGPISELPGGSTAPSPPPCAHLFLDPLSWMRPELEQGKLDGRLECPNARCGTNVGKYAWQGMRCSCGKWVVPGISLARGRVDEVKSRTGAGGVAGKI